MLAAEPQNVDAWTEAYEIAVVSADTPEAGRTALRLLEIHLRLGDRDLASNLIADASERVTTAALPLRFLMSAASFLEKEGDARAALELYQQVTTRSPEDPASFRAWFRQGEILRASGDHRSARGAYEQARRHPLCVEPWPQTIDRAVAQLG